MHPSLLFLIPARGGSKGLPRKNLRELAGIPLVGWAARRAALAALRLGGAGHRVVCSTDDPEIAAVAREWGAETPFERPLSLAADDSPASEVALHTLARLDAAGESFDALVLIQPTSPLATADDVVGAVRSFLDGDGSPVASTSASHPAAWNYRLEAGRLVPAAPPPGRDERRQDHRESVALNGAVFVTSPERLRRDRRLMDPVGTLAFAMPADRGVDVDREQDLALCEALLDARPTPDVAVGAHTLGPGRRCFVIAEAGVNHDGSEETAHRLVDLAGDAGADAVKFQTWITERVCLPGAPKAEYQRRSSEDADQYSLLKRLELPRPAWPRLKRHAEERGLVFLSTPDEIESARLLCELGVAALKIGSGELTNLPFLRELAGLGRPILLSTGMGTMRDVACAVDAIRSAGEAPLVLLHCVSAYPAPALEMNLRCLTTLRRAFEVPVGLSDHTIGFASALLAVGQGMALLEKHITLDRGLPGPDHAASADGPAFTELVRSVREAEAALGDGAKRPTPSEVGTLAAVRRSLVYGRDLPAGHVLRRGDLEALRVGGGGMPPDGARALEGAALSRAVRRGQLASKNHVR